MAFFFEAGRGLSYSSWLTTCIQGLALRLVPSHTSATVLTLHRWRVAELQKHTFRGENSFDIAKKPITRFPLEVRHVPFDYDQGFYYGGGEGCGDGKIKVGSVVFKSLLPLSGNQEFSK